VAERLLVEPSAGLFQDRGADRRGASIRPDQDLERRLGLGALRGRETQLAFCEIDAADRLSKPDRDSAGRLGGLHEQRVQAPARHRIDDFMRLVSVGNEAQPSLLVVEHPSGHRNERGPEALHHTHLFERGDAAIGERQVDRAPGGGRRRRLPGIGAALEERHAVAAPGQKDRQERAGETGADERDIGGGARGSQTVRLPVILSEAKDPELPRRRWCDRLGACRVLDPSLSLGMTASE
jgi:hypothetical protein